MTAPSRTVLEWDKPSFWLAALALGTSIASIFAPGIASQVREVAAAGSLFVVSLFGAGHTFSVLSHNKVNSTSSIPNVSASMAAKNSQGA
jgi:hypothetical protein